MDAGGEQLSLGAVRDALIREEDSIVFALIERAKRPRNAPAYSTADGRSLAEFFVREAETLHAKATNTRNKSVLSFYSMPEYETWKESLGGNASGWSIKYYKEKEAFIEEIKVQGDEASVEFVVTLSEKNMNIAKQEGLEKKFKLTTTIGTTNMKYFGANWWSPEGVGVPGLLGGRDSHSSETV